MIDLQIPEIFIRYSLQKPEGIARWILTLDQLQDPIFNAAVQTWLSQYPLISRGISIGARLYGEDIFSDDIIQIRDRTSPLLLDCGRWICIINNTILSINTILDVITVISPTEPTAKNGAT
jgi:hypothetical protein